MLLEAEILRLWKEHRATLLKRYPDDRDKFCAAEIIHLRKLARQVMLAAQANSKKQKVTSPIVRRGAK